KNEDGGRASKALQNFADDPQLYGNVFEGMLHPLLQSDPSFADTVTQILHSGPIQRIVIGHDAKVEDVHMTNEFGQGIQTIEGGDRATFSDVTFNIGPK